MHIRLISNQPLYENNQNFLTGWLASSNFQLMQEGILSNPCCMIGPYFDMLIVRKGINNKAGTLVFRERKWNAYKVCSSDNELRSPDSLPVKPMLPNVLELKPIVRLDSNIAE